MKELYNALFMIKALYIIIGGAVIALIAAAIIILLTLRTKKSVKSKPAEPAKELKTVAEEVPAAPVKSEEAEIAAEETPAAPVKSEETEIAAEETPAAPLKSEEAEIAPEETPAASVTSEEAEIAPEEIPAAPVKSEEAEIAPEETPAASVTSEEAETAVIGKSIEKQEDTEIPVCERPAYSGKFEISLRNDGFHFSLIANNGQLLYDSYGYMSAQGALNGIENFKKAVEEGTFTVYKDKFGRYRFVLNKRYAGENYTNKLSCENSVNSVKRFAKTAVTVPYVFDEEAEKLYEQARKNLKTVTDEEWESVLSREVKPSGKYEIAAEDDGHHFYLVANNGQLLYSSRSYTTAAGAAEGINTFKRAVYTGNFYVDEDKFGKFRYILRGAGGSIIYTGESFTSQKSALNNVESVKNFALSAVIKV